MPDTTNPQFKLVVPITGYTIRKDANGVEKYVVTGLASNTSLDLTGERMADSAINAMIKSIETNRIYLNNEHGSDWDDDFGEVTKLWATDAHEMMMEAELDPDHYRTKTLIKALDKGRKLGLSIGGYVKEAAREWFADAARMVMTYKDISLFHVAITGTPAVAETWVTPITKSVKDWKEMPMPNDKTTKSDDVVETPSVKVVADAVVGTGETPVVEPVVEPSKPAEQPIAAPVETPAAEGGEETPAEPVVEEVKTDEPVVEKPTEVETPKPTEGNTPEAPKPDTTQKSDAPAVEKPADTHVTPQPEATPVVEEAPEQKDEAPASTESAPAPAEAGTSAIAKSDALGDWAEVGLVTSSVETLSYQLQNYIWDVLCQDEDDNGVTITAAEKVAKINDGLDDFKVLILKVATALVEDENTEAVKTAAHAFKATSPEAVTKSLADKATEIQTLTKSLADTEVKLETTKSDLDARTVELETTTTALKTAETQLETIKARKAIVFDKFAGATDAKLSTADTDVLEAQKKFASFITSGIERS